MRHLHLISAALFAFAITCAASSAHAAVITWGSATDVVGTSDVSTNGELEEAFNLGYKAADLSTVTVNTVEFTASVAPAPLTELIASTYNQLNGNSSGNASYDNLLNSVAFGGGTDLVNMTVGGGNLVNGRDYEIQLWYVEERSGDSGRVMQYGDGNANTVDVGGSAGQLGQYVIGTFTANGANQTLTMDPQGFGNSHLTAYQIRLLSVSVPEPSSGIIAIVGAVVVLTQRRRASQRCR